jgi:predicted O-methyltransferase YrrM
MKNRIELARHFNQLGLRVGAEIGVSGGINAENLCKEIPGLKLYCIDSWEGERGERGYQKARIRLQKYDAIFIRKASMEAVNDFKDGSLDFVFIDANHNFDFVIEDITEWSKKVRTNGVVSGHDYYHSASGRIGVIEAVDAYVNAYNIKLNLTTKDINSRDDKEPSFWWTKP